MKKISIIALVLVLTLALAACGRRDNNVTSAPTTEPSTDVTIIPDMDPTMDTNIPDPSVDTSMPMYTDGTDATDNSGSTDGMTSRSRRGY